MRCLYTQDKIKFIQIAGNCVSGVVENAIKLYVSLLYYQTLLNFAIWLQTKGSVF